MEPAERRSFKDKAVRQEPAARFSPKGDFIMGRRRSTGGVKLAARKITVKLLEREHAGKVTEPYRIMEDLVERHHADLVDAKIAIAWRYGKKDDADGRLWLGQAKKGSDLDRSLHGYDFVILLNYEAWQAVSVEQWRVALIDHELTHCTVSKDSNGEAKTDEAGRIVYRTRKHDLEEFREIVARHGQWKQDIVDFVAAALKDKREAEDRPLLAAAEANGKARSNGKQAGNGQVADSGDWRKIALKTMFSGPILKALREAKFKALGNLADYTAGGKLLTDIPGIGTGLAGEIVHRLDQFWKDHPELSDDPAASVPVK